MSTIISMRSVKKQFNNKVVLDGLNFELKAGQVMGLLGRNAAGKSTMMKIAMGLVLPNEGELRTLDELPEHFSDAVRDRIGYVAQEFNGFQAFRVRELLSFIAQFYSRWDEQYQDSLLKRFELDPQQKIIKLSGGQKQLVALVMALAHRPQLLVLDEPVSALDPLNRREFLAELIQLAIDNDSTVLFSTHITSDIERVASHVCFLSGGKIALQGELDDIRDRVRKIPSNMEPTTQATLLTSTPEFKVVRFLEDATQGQTMNLDDLFVTLNQNREVVNA